MKKLEGIYNISWKHEGKRYSGNVEIMKIDENKYEVFVNNDAGVPFERGILNREDTEYLLKNLENASWDITEFPNVL